jgi:hypothetical protein
LCARPAADCPLQSSSYLYDLELCPSTMGLTAQLDGVAWSIAYVDFAELRALLCTSATLRRALLESPEYGRVHSLKCQQLHQYWARLGFAPCGVTPFMFRNSDGRQRPLLSEALCLNMPFQRALLPQRRQFFSFSRVPSSPSRAELTFPDT